MDLTATIVPKSDQLNAEDMLSGPMTVTVESVSKGNAEQPVDFHLVETPGRAYRPSKTERRVIVKAWGAESDAYTGRRMTLYRDPDVRFGGQKVGGIKVSHLSHITKAFSVALTETRGKRVMRTIEPLPDTAPATPVTPTPDEVAALTDLAALKDMWRAHPTLRAQIEARVHELTTTETPPADPPVEDEPLWADQDAEAGR